MDGQMNILLVEDEPDLREDLSELLELEGCAVRAAANGAEGLETLEGGYLPDVVLSDRLMPVMDGDALLKRVRSDTRWSDLPFLFMSALSGDAQEIACLRSGVDCYVPKPVRIELLLERLRAAARNAQNARRRADAEIERRRAAFLAVIPHELRTPLTPILGYSELLRADAQLPPNARDMAQNIHDGASALLRRLNDILDLGAAAHRRMDIHLDSASFADMAREGIAHALAEGLGHQVTFIEDFDDIRLIVDPRLFRRALSAVISNAAKFAPEQTGRVEVAIREDGVGALAITISDNGPGFGPRARAAAGRLFEQADTSHTRRFGGQGLGLPLAAAICAAHGGALTVSNRATGGAVVRLILPPTANGRRLI